MSDAATARVYEILTGEDDGRVCRDIPEEACRHQPRNFFIHVLSLAATKTGDGLADPKLVLAWLLGAMGAPAAAIGLLVPLREALALLPQMATAARIRSMPRRKWAWAAGSAVQGACVAAMAVAGLTMDGAAGGWTIVALLALFALARSVCSVSYKDVLGKTVSKQSRGTATGTAGTISAVAVVVFGILLSLGVLPLNVTVICGALFLAGALWIAAAALFSTLAEEAGATEGGGNPLSTAIAQVRVLGQDPQLVRFICVRGLLTATALAPPFLLALAGRDAGSRQLAELGPFVIAASLAAVTSNYLWGRFADRSSRFVLTAAGAIAAVVLGATGAAALALPGGGALAGYLPVALFVLMIAYQGVRLGRSTHIVDMADEDRRATYTALSNTIIGVVLIAGSLFGIIAELAGVPALLVCFAAMCLAAALMALGLDEVQQA